MENPNRDKALQFEAVKHWMAALDESFKDGPRPGEIDRKMAEARHKFCETVAGALTMLIIDSHGDEDAILYALVAMAQLYGVRGAIAGTSTQHTMRMVIDACRHMMTACQATMADQPPPVNVGAVH